MKYSLPITVLPRGIPAPSPLRRREKFVPTRMNKANSIRASLKIGHCEIQLTPVRVKTDQNSLSVLNGRGRFRCWNKFSGAELNRRFNCGEFQAMSDQELAVQAISEAQRILEEYLEPKHHDNEGLLDRLVEVLERPSVLVAVHRLRRGGAGQ
jgi:hypothetical protein